MKLILSRKGTDSASGKMPSPILPDGTLLSLPIPDENSGLRYDDISYGEKSYMEIIQELKPSFNEGECCHLDPDIRDDIDGRSADWKPAFGQCGAAAAHLDNNEVGKNDLFLFFGWFRQSEYGKNGKLRFVRGARDLHIIYGYMQIGDVVRSADIQKYYWHPHAKHDLSDKTNRLYVPRDTLSFADGVKGYGVLNYDKRNVLTKDDMSRSKWDLPQCFYSDDVNISWSGDCFRTASNGEKYFQSPGRGQEMVINITDGIMDWIKNIVL